MTDLINDLKQTVKKHDTNKSADSPFVSLFIKLKEIKDEGGVFYAYGTDLILEKEVRVRLNTIDEGAQDFLTIKRASTLLEAKNKITNLYTGKNSRHTLEQKKKKLDSKYFHFERAVLLDAQSFIPTYRAHWSYSMSQNEDVEMVVAHMNITYRPEKQVGSYFQKAAAYTHAIEFMRDFKLGEIETNKKMLHFALNNYTGDMVREGALNILINKGDKSIAELKILQSFESKQVTNAQGQQINIALPTSAEESVSQYLQKDEGSISTFSLTKDIGKIVLHVFCGYPFDTALCASDESDYLEQLNQIKNKLLSGEYTVTVFGTLIYRFGAESFNKLTPKGNFNPLIHYSKLIATEAGLEPNLLVQTYLPTILILHKTPNNRRYIAYHNRLSPNLFDEYKPLSLYEFSEDIQPMKRKFRSLVNF